MGVDRNFSEVWVLRINERRVSRLRTTIGHDRIFWSDIDLIEHGLDCARIRLCTDSIAHQLNCARTRLRTTRLHTDQIAHGPNCTRTRLRTIRLHKDPIAHRLDCAQLQSDTIAFGHIVLQWDTDTIAHGPDCVLTQFHTDPIARKHIVHRLNRIYRPCANLSIGLVRNRVCISLQHYVSDCYCVRLHLCNLCENMCKFINNYVFNTFVLCVYLFGISVIHDL